ncbi:MAG: helix-turn-helix domain-containing protein [Actinomycetota bacterium]|nr:helix-turn-helix domain-containing protein [Actinomycetota bacterium]
MNSRGSSEGPEREEWAWDPAYQFDDPMYGGPDPRGERVYTIRQAAEATGLSEKLIREEIEAGNIPVVDLPGERRTMVRRQDLDAYIRTRRKRKVVDEGQE